jgi:hypothetical protein
MKTTAREEKAMWECYKRLFKESTPSGDFEYLVENATINDRGQKEIPFMDYEIEQDKLDSIINDVISEFKIKPKYRQQAFKSSIYLGCSPKTKKPLL